MDVYSVSRFRLRGYSIDGRVRINSCASAAVHDGALAFATLRLRQQGSLGADISVVIRHETEGGIV